MRLRSLDLFRGLTVAGMILVNCSGSDDVFPTLDHAPWNGLTLADLVFPSFLVVLGVSAALSYAARRARGESRADFVLHAAERAVGLFALGVLINFVVFREAGGIRWPGVLQRISVCWLGTSLFLLADVPALEPSAIAVLLAGYWLLLTRVPVPGHGPGALTPEGNLASWLDRRLMGGHLETALQDPEGLLSTIPALATTLIGLAAGRRLAAPGVSREGEATRLLGAGAALTALGWAWGLSFPINKHLWTSSFALLTSGLCLAGLGACLGLPAESLPGARSLEALGRRALPAYVLSGFVYGVLEFLPARLPDGSRGNAKLWLNAHLFASWLRPRPASLAFALVFTAASSVLAARAERDRPR